MTGTCECLEGYVQDSKGECFLLDEVSLRPAMSNIITEHILDIGTNKSMPVTRQQLIVKAESKEVMLPEDEATLVAFVEHENPDEKYQYEWTSLHQPEGSTAVKHQNEGHLHLEKLTEGVYSFKVTTMLLKQVFQKATSFMPFPVLGKQYKSF